MKRLLYLVLAVTAIAITQTVFSQSSIQLKLLGIAPETEAKLLPGDKIKSGLGYNNVTLRLKNTGDRSWRLSSSYIYKINYDSVARHYTIDMPLNIPGESKFYDLKKPVVIRVLIHTDYNNYIWSEFIRNPEQITEPISLNNYSGEEGDPKKLLKNPSASAPVTPGQALPASIKKKIVELRQHGARLEVDQLPDSLTNTLLKATLLREATVILGMQELKLQEGKPVQFNPGQGIVVAGYSKGNQSIRTSAGLITLRDGSPVQFHAFKLKGAMLAAPAELQTEYGPITFKDNISEEADISFDESGQILAGTIARPLTLTPGGSTVNVPVLSRLQFRNRKITAISLAESMEIELGGIKYRIKSSTMETSIGLDAKTGMIEELLAGPGQSIVVEQVSIPIREGSRITFRESEGKMVVHKFYLGADMKLNELGKKDKVKEVDAKAGRRITIKDGRITDIGRF